MANGAALNPLGWLKFDRHLLLYLRFIIYACSLKGKIWERVHDYRWRCRFRKVTCHLETWI